MRDEKPFPAPLISAIGLDYVAQAVAEGRKAVQADAYDAFEFFDGEMILPESPIHQAILRQLVEAIMDAFGCTHDELVAAQSAMRRDHPQPELSVQYAAIKAWRKLRASR